MYDIEALERQWQRYRRKRMFRIGAIAAGILVVLGAPILYSTLKHGGAGEVKSENGMTSVNHSVGETNRSVQKVSDRDQQKVLQPEVPSLSTPTPRPKKPKMLITLSDRNGEAVEMSEAPAAKKKIQLEMTDAKNREVVKEIEARFPDTRDYDDAMYLAKYYYGKRQYRKAETWAMRANGIDSSQEESWLLYGKAKAKQGHRAEALRILQAYYDQSGSLRAKMLIDRIRKGKKF